MVKHIGKHIPRLRGYGTPLITWNSRLHIPKYGVAAKCVKTTLLLFLSLGLNTLRRRNVQRVAQFSKGLAE